MDRVTQTQTPETSRSPEIRLVQVALGGLRQELFHDAFAYRPLPRKDVNSGVTRFLPQRIREYAGLLPHATVAFAALIVFLIGGERTHGSFGRRPGGARNHAELRRPSVAGVGAVLERYPPHVREDHFTWPRSSRSTRRPGAVSSAA